MADEAMTTYIGIDPGKSGGIAVWCAGDMQCWKMPETEADILGLLSAWSSNAYAYIEHVHAMARKGPICPVCKRRPTEGTVSTFAFGMNYGALRMALTAAGIPWEPVPPSSWLRQMRLTKQAGETKTQWKNRHKAMAQRMWPSVKFTHATADAALIAEYCRRMQTGRLQTLSAPGVGKKARRKG